MAAYQAFKEPYHSVDLTDSTIFEAYEARAQRYALLWALFENTAYRQLHKFSSSMKTDLGLYRYIRNIYNPANRDGIFWQTHLLGGSLDMAAGDGEEIPSALPILTDNPAHRTALGTLWKWSNWNAQKDLLSLYGSVLGDVGIKVVDDTERSRVYLEIVRPSSLKDVVFDAFGNVKGYIIEEKRDDPREELSVKGRVLPKVTYTEIARRLPESDEVIYQTFLDNKLYPWVGGMTAWTEPYGFIPLVVIQHNNIGYDWGWSEMQPVLPKVREVDDQASKIGDQIRKLVDAPWLFSGVDDPRKKVKTGAGGIPGQPAASPGDESGRQEIPVLYGPPGATATPLVAPLDLAAGLKHIEALLAELERDLPELQHDIWSTSEPSGRALRIARQRVVSKVQMRRVGYDDKLVKAYQMGLSIGGFRNYQGFAGFNLDSYKAGDLNFAIGEREVFATDPLDQYEEEQAFWATARAAQNSGVALEIYLRSANWSEADIQEVLGTEYYGVWLANQSGTPMG